MKKILVALFLPLLLVSCDKISSKKVKNIIELTPKLIATSAEPIDVGDQLLEDVITSDKSLVKSYSLTKNHMISKPIFAKGVIYISDNKGIVSAFSKKDKMLLWSQNTSYHDKNYHHTGGGILFHENRLYVTNGAKYLVILDAATGHEIMRKEFFDIVKTAPVMLGDNVVLIQTVSNQLVAYDVKNSKIVWQHEGLFETLSSTNHIAPVVYNNQVIVNYSSGQIFALNAATGQELWGINLSVGHEISLPSFESVTLSCAPIVEHDSLYLASNNGKLVKLNVANGMTIWQIEASDIQSMSTNGNSLFVTNNARQVAAISKNTGAVKWVADMVNNSGKKNKAAQFLSPFVTAQEDGKWILSVPSNEGLMYRYASNGQYLSIEPIVTKIIGNVIYSGKSCCGEFYVANDKHIVFFGK